MTTDRAGNCVVCQARDARYGMVCDSDRSRLSRWLVEIPELLAELAGGGYVQRDVRGVRVDDEGVRWPHYDHVANVLPTGPIAGPGAGGHVGGSKDPPVPISVNDADLLASARVLHLTDLRKVYDGRYPEHHEDQVGHLSVAAVLDGWVRDWRDLRNRGEGLPEPSVPTLCNWLQNRIEWACDEHPAVDEFAGELGKLRSALYGLLGLYDHPDYKAGVPCRSCDALTLVRRSGSDYVECGSCPALLSPDEYQRWVGLLAAEVKQRAKEAAAG
jgi:hypothetical protein